MNLQASHDIVHVCKHHENEHNAARHPCLNHCAHFGPRSKSHHGFSRLCKQISVFYVQVQLLECQRTFRCNCSSMCPKDAVYSETWYVSIKRQMLLKTKPVNSYRPQSSTSKTRNSDRTDFKERQESLLKMQLCTTLNAIRGAGPPAAHLRAACDFPEDAYNKQAQK